MTDEITATPGAVAAMRAAVIEEARWIERQERLLEGRKRGFPKLIEELRAACPHRSAVQVWGTWIDESSQRTFACAHRYCLACGRSDEAAGRDLQDGQWSFRFRKLSVSSVVRSEHFLVRDVFHRACDMLRERLTVECRFDEFDARGVWRGEQAGHPHIQRGED